MTDVFNEGKTFAGPTGEAETKKGYVREIRSPLATRKFGWIAKCSGVDLAKKGWDFHTSMRSAHATQGADE